MATVAAAVVLAGFVLPRPWGLALLAGAIAWEILEKVYWFYRTKRFPLAVGPEAMIGQPVDVIAACRPDGKVRLSNERWNATCPQGADIGETVIVERIERLTLIVSPRPTHAEHLGRLAGTPRKPGEGRRLPRPSPHPVASPRGETDASSMRALGPDERGTRGNCARSPAPIAMV